MVEEGRGAYWSDPIEMEDPRLSGALHYARNRDCYGGFVESGLGETHADRYALIDLDGTWVGVGRGYVTTDPRYHDWHLEPTGTGAYEGPALLHIAGPAGGP